MMLLKRILLPVLLMAIPIFSYAASDIEITLSPKNAAPYQEVTITLSSYAFDPNLAMITWKSGTRTILSGLGAKKLSVTMGAGGQTIPISYTATLANGSTYSGSLSLSPQSVDLLYESKESYVPPFYEGRVLPGEGAMVRVSAIPAINEGASRVSPSALSYHWYANGEYLEGASGTGKSVATIGLDYLSNSTDVRVLVRSPLGSTAEKTITIPPHEVMPLLYPYDELLGTKLSSSFFRRMELAGDITLSLEPYYLSTNNNLEAFSTYDWYLDGLPITPLEKTLVSFRPKADSSGIKTLTIVVENTKRRLQRAQISLEILFDTRK
jgi:hypothetical protein